MTDQGWTQTDDVGLFGTDASLDRTLVVTASMLRTAYKLGLQPGETARVLGLPLEAVHAMYANRRTLEVDSVAWAYALELLRLWQTLCARFGHEERVQQWLRTRNAGLGGEPLAIALERGGLGRVIDYLEELDGR